MSAYTAFDEPRPRVGSGVKQLALAYLWITIASGAVVYWEPAPYDLLMLGAMALLPLVGLVRFTRGIGLYLLLWTGIVAAGFVGAMQAGVFDVPAKHMAITLYLALSSVVIAAFVLDRPERNVRLIMSAYLFAALVAACTGLIGYFHLLPGTVDLFTMDGARARGTFKDPNVFGAFLVPALLYGLNLLIRAGVRRSAFWLLATPVLLFGSVLSFSRGAWLNLALSVLAYAYLAFAVAESHRQRLKLVVYAMLGAILAVGIVAAALTIPQVAELMGERASLEQPYDAGPDGRFGGQIKAVGLILAYPLGIGALEFGRAFHPGDVHEVYLNMFLSAGWVGGVLYVAVVLLTLWLGMQRVIRDRGGDGVSAVLLAAFIGMAFEGVVIDTDHWRHFYLIMAMIWGMALAQRPAEPWQRRRLPDRTG